MAVWWSDLCGDIKTSKNRDIEVEAQEINIKS